MSLPGIGLDKVASDVGEELCSFNLQTLKTL